MNKKNLDKLKNAILKFYSSIDDDDISNPSKEYLESLYISNNFCESSIIEEFSELGVRGI